MKKTLLPALLMLGSLSAFAQTGTTSVTASNLKMGGTPIAAGTATITPITAADQAIPFIGADHSVNSPQGFSATITNGSLASGFTVPDQALSTATQPGTPLWYEVSILNTATKSSYKFLLPPNTVTGTTFALDQYAPAQAATSVTGLIAAATTPAHCSVPSVFYPTVPTNGQYKIGRCVAGVYVFDSSSTSASVSAATATAAGIVQLGSKATGNTLANVASTGAAADISGLGAAINSGLAAAGVSTDSTKNGAVTLSYTGTAATAPASNSMQVQQAVAVTTPYTLSYPAAPPPDSTHNVLSWVQQTINGQSVLLGTWTSAGGSTLGTIPGEWFLNEGTGSTSANQGTGPVLALSNGTWTTQSGLSGGALAFNGLTNTSTQTVASAAGTSFSLASGQAMGVCGYVAPSSVAQYARFLGTESSSGSTSGVSGWELGLQNGAFFFEVAGTGGYAGNDSYSVQGGSYSANALAFVCVNYTGSTATISVNNASQTVTTIKSTLSTSPASTGALTVGKLRGDTTTAAGNSVLGGNLGPVWIVIGRTFTTTEMTTMYGNPYAKI